MKDNEYITRIIKYSEKIAKYMNGVSSYHEFETNEEKLDAVIMNLEQIGETAKKLSDDFKKLYSKIEWTKIIGLRNIISHEYEGIELTIIYEIVTKSIPELLII